MDQTRRYDKEWTLMVDEDVGLNDSLEQLGDGAFVEVMFAKTQDEAVRCRDLLEKHSIPARVEPPVVDSRIAGVSVLVPGTRLDDASELLALSAADEEDEPDDGGFDDSDDDDDYDDDDDDFDDDDDDEEAADDDE